MLIDFTVENYRSIREAVTLSAVAHGRGRKRATSKTGSMPDAGIAAPFQVEGRDMELLPVIGIFGANASGKSNVIRALDHLFRLIIFGSREGSQVNNYLRQVVPFKLDRNNAMSPTRFEMRVSLESGIYIYVLVANQKRIIKEALEQIPPPPRRKQSRLLYSREWNTTHEDYDWKNGRVFSNKYLEIQKATKQDELFLGLLANRLKIEAVQDFIAWLWCKWPGVTYGQEDADHDTAVKMLKRNSDIFKDVTRIIKTFDTGITDLEIRGKHDDDSEEESASELWSLHRTPDGDVWWQFEEESIGTQRLFDLITKLVLNFNWGGMIVADELGSSIHPNIVRTIIRMFQSTETNPKRAQLIFTSHDHTLQRSKVLRRDQIWFTQKRPDGSTELFPLTDFSPRNDLAIDKAYIDGRFGAVPILPKPEDLMLKT